jgi:formylmethanofuran dehydrogenase subunit E
MVQDLDIYLEKARAFHGDACAGILMGTRLTLAAMKALGMDPSKRNKNLIVFVEIDRCMTDAVQAITGCSLGHRTLKYMNYGKFGAVFYDMNSQRAVRVHERKGIKKQSGEDISKIFLTLPDEELIQLEEVEVNLEKKDLPGKPEKIEACSQCGELIFDDRGEKVGGRLLCRSCAQGAYYKPRVTKITKKAGTNNHDETNR